MMTSNNQVGVSEFYRGKDVFITGVTGFIGKVLLEKLLRCCEVRKVFVLIRPKKGKTVDQRKNELFQSELFRRIRDQKEEVLSKVVFLKGDITKKNVGLSQLDISLIIENVSIVIHCAACVSFALNFSYAERKGVSTQVLTYAIIEESVVVNVLSTREMANLCRNIRNLLVFVYVSTAFSNCNEKEIEELVYPLQTPIQGVLKATEWFDDESLQAICQELSNGRPNTYVVTKAMAENLLKECYADIPWTIVRPSIVVASWKEPIPGWVEGLIGATGVFAGNFKFLLSSMVIDVNKKAELIPVDSLVNALLVAAWDKGTGRSMESKVYNITSTPFNSLSWNDVLNYSNPTIWRYPPASTFLTFSWKTTTNEKMHQISVILKDYIPAILADLYFSIQGKQLNILKSCQNMNKLLKALRPFMMNEWSFRANNTFELLDKLSPEEKEIFSFDIRDMDWKSFMDKYVLGIRTYILKEDPTTVEKARKSLLRKHFILTKLSLFLKTVVLYKSAVFIFKHFLYVLKIILFKLKTRQRSLTQIRNSLAKGENLLSKLSLV